jgi:rhodanese-related sulfurtransferase
LRVRAPVFTIGGMATVSPKHAAAADAPDGNRFLTVAIVAFAAWLTCSCGLAFATKTRPSVHETTLEEQNQKTPELATDELKAVLARGGAIVFDARAAEEYASAHIPGSLILDEKQLGRFTQSFPDRSTSIVVYSNGPFCERARLRSEDLLRLGYSRISRYQLGLPVWRALGNSAETSLQGFRQATRDSNAVIVDARSRDQYAAGTVPGAQAILAGEVSKAEKDRRLRYLDHSTRVIVFADGADDARAVADELARNAYSNASYIGGTYAELKRAKFFTERKPSASDLNDLTK